MSFADWLYEEMLPDQKAALHNVMINPHLDKADKLYTMTTLVDVHVTPSKISAYNMQVENDADCIGVCANNLIAGRWIELVS